MKNYLNKLIALAQICFSIARANFKLKNEGSILGLFWYVLQPLSLFLVIMLVRTNKEFEKGVDYYPVYLIQGLVLLNFFNTIINSTLTTVIENANILRSMKTSLGILVVSKVIQALMSHIIEIILMMIIAVTVKIPLYGFIFYPVIILPILAFAMGIGFICTILGAYVKDAMNVWRICYQLLMLISPIAYTISPNTALYVINLINPFFYFLEISRQVILLQSIPELFLIIATAILSSVTLFLGYRFFNHYKKYLPELV
jgi:ABC-type polysaccharide/polyol phosphate export permease